MKDNLKAKLIFIKHCIIMLLIIIGTIFVNSYFFILAVIYLIPIIGSGVVYFFPLTEKEKEWIKNNPGKYSKNNVTF